MKNELFSVVFSGIHRQFRILGIDALGAVVVPGSAYVRQFHFLLFFFAKRDFSNFQRESRHGGFCRPLGLRLGGLQKLFPRRVSRFLMFFCKKTLFAQKKNSPTVRWDLPSSRTTSYSLFRGVGTFRLAGRLRQKCSFPFKFLLKSVHFWLLCGGALPAGRPAASKVVGSFEIPFKMCSFSLSRVGGPSGWPAGRLKIVRVLLNFF